MAQTLFDAARRDDVALAKELLAEDPTRLNCADWAGSTALHVACMLRAWEVADVLIVAGANASALDGIGKSPLDYIVRFPEQKALLQRKADAFGGGGDDYLDDDSTIQGNTNVIRDAAYHGDMAAIDAMLDAEPHLLHVTDKKGHTPLIMACMGQQVDTACYLLERGADVHAATSYKWTASMFIKDLVKRDNVLKFAYKVSPEGKAAALAAMARRKQEEREAILDETYKVMDTLRSVIMAREDLLMREAKILSAYSSIVVERLLPIPLDNALAHFIRLEILRLEELKREEEARVEMTRLEAEQRKTEFLRKQLELKLELKERNKMAEAEAEMHEYNYQSEELKKRIAAEIEAERLRKRNEVSLARATAQAAVEWHELEHELKMKEWQLHVKKKPRRVRIYERMRLALATTLVSKTRSASRGSFEIDPPEAEALR